MVNARDLKSRSEKIVGSSPTTPNSYAMQSTHRKYKHAALIFVNGILITFSNNTQEEHAETRALNIARMLGYKAYDMTLMSIRVLKNGNLGMAKPCKKCMRYIRMFRDVKILYSNAKGVIIKL